MKHIQLDQQYSSIVFEFEASFSDAEVYVEINHEKIQLIEDPHAREGVIRSQLIVPREMFDRLTIISNETIDNISIYTFFVPKPALNKADEKKSILNNCDKPTTIDQATWRSGLPAPAVSPTETDVQHIIVHHSAGSNTNTNYTEVVRNIYTYHTSAPPAGNGWDDIGYNFVIAQDGSIFEGRDGQGLYDGDNVQGAHYCSKNSGTMGVCLLGTYTSETPADTMMRSLLSLCAWKCDKENIDPISSFIHPVSSGSQLDVIAGHRQGCATECPGQEVFDRLGELRNNTSAKWADCNTIASVGEEINPLFDLQARDNILYVTNASNNPLDIVLYSLTGAVIFSQDNVLGEVGFDIKHLPIGVYVVLVEGNGKSVIEKVMRF